MALALIDAFAMAAIFLMDNPDNVGIFLLIAISDGAGVVRTAIIHQDDFRLFATVEQGLNAVVHICCGIVAWHRKGDQFQKESLLYLLLPGVCSERKRS